jgi:hypothetical protein
VVGWVGWVGWVQPLAAAQTAPVQTQAQQRVAVLVEVLAALGSC